ncbi:MAG TPA: hypothetical protein VFI65_18570 [Streptosporangiaceae bacterium]|nr:hypothetical protein [Streptosporangiaceae bacterium]
MTIATIGVAGVASAPSALAAARPLTVLTLTVTHVPGTTAPADFTIAGRLTTFDAGTGIGNAIIQYYLNGNLIQSKSTNSSGNVSFGEIGLTPGTEASVELKFPGNNSYVSSHSVTDMPHGA